MALNDFQKAKLKPFSSGLKADQGFLKLPDRFTECKDRPHLREGGVRWKDVNQKKRSSQALGRSSYREQFRKIQTKRHSEV